MNIWQMIGPIAILASFAMMAHLPISSIDLAIIGILGIGISACHQVKGCRFAIFFLVFCGLAAHLFWESHHLIRLGLEMNLGLSFIMTALGSEMQSSDVCQLQSKLTSQKGAIQNLEDEKIQLNDQFTTSRMDFEKKLEELQKNFDEMGSEKSTLEILNDVLRKTNAAHLKEKNELEKQILEDQREFSTFSKMSDEKIHVLSKYESLYKQLKGQFDEKIRVLHETRSSLFKLETEMQRIAIQKEHEMPLPDPMHEGLHSLDIEIERLTSENQELLAVVTHLTNTLPHADHRTPLPRVKSTVKETLRETLTPKKKKKRESIQLPG